MKAIRRVIPKASLVCAAVLVSSVLILPSGTAAAVAPTVAKGHISFITNIDGLERIGTSRLDGTDEHIAALKNGFDQFFSTETPRWSPDGESVLFVTNTGGATSHVRTMRADAGGIQDHGTIPAERPIAWTPEGEVAWLDNPNGLMEAPIDDLSSATLVAPGLQGLGLDYSPDGTQVAYANYTDGYHIWIANRDGTSPVQVTTGTPGQFDPRWSPDGSRIAYRLGDGGNKMQIHTISPDGTGDLALTSTGKNFDAAWSADGTMLAFNSSRSGGGVWAMNGDGSDQHLEAVGNMGWLDWQAAHATIGATDALVVIGDAATVTASTPGAQTSGTLSIFRVRAGTDSLVKIDQGTPDANGERRLRLKPNASASYLSYWSGDGVDPGGWGDVVSVRVQVRLTAKTQGGYATKSGVRLYHFTSTCAASYKGCPDVEFTLAPPHPGEMLIVVFEVFKDGAWRLADHRAWKLKDGKVVSLVWVYSSRAFIGRTYRAMATFRSDDDHKGDGSKWVRVRVTN
jgi:hypothetical protein